MSAGAPVLYSSYFAGVGVCLVFLFVLHCILSALNVLSCFSLHNEDSNFSASVSVSESSRFIRSLLISIIGLAYNPVRNGEDLVGFRALNH